MIWSCSKQNRAFTLIELLAVIVILTLAAGVTIASLAAASTDSRLRATIGAVRDLDQRARLLARTLPYGEAVLLCKDGVSLSLSTSSDTTLIGSVGAPPNAVIQLRTSNGGDRVVFDRLGNSSDYEVEIRGQETAVRLYVCGLTGLAMEHEP